MMLPRWARLAKREAIQDASMTVDVGGIDQVSDALCRISATLDEMLELMGRKDMRER
jgi:hypothetical protein